MFSKACEYGIRSVLYIAKESQQDRRSNISKIAKAIDSPEPFTAKICQQLARAGVILSKKGPKGGFYIEKDSKMRLMDIVVAIDGDAIFYNCGLGLNQCNPSHPCPIHSQFEEVKSRLKTMCENTLVVDLADSLEEGDTFLKV